MDDECNNLHDNFLMYKNLKYNKRNKMTMNF